MAKKIVKKAMKKPVKKSIVSGKKHWMTSTGWFFVNLILLAIFLYGGYIIWAKDWTEGLSIIVLDLIIILIIKLVLRFRKK